MATKSQKKNLSILMSTVHTPLQCWQIFFLSLSFSHSIFFLLLFNNLMVLNWIDLMGKCSFFRRKKKRKIQKIGTFFFFISAFRLSIVCHTTASFHSYILERIFRWIDPDFIHIFFLCVCLCLFIIIGTTIVNLFIIIILNPRVICSMTESFPIFPKKSLLFARTHTHTVLKC